MTELQEKIRTGLKEQRAKGNQPQQCKIEMLVPERELAEYPALEVLLAAVENKLMVSACAYCDSFLIAGRWVKPSMYTKLLKENYQNLSWTYCEKHVELVKI